MIYKTYRDVKNSINYIMRTENYYCSYCLSEINNNLIIHRAYNKNKNPKLNLYCSGCSNKIRLVSDLDEVNNFIIITRLPKNVERIYLTPAVLGQSGKTVFSEALQKSNDGVKIIDNTRFTGLESWNGFKIGKEVSHLDLASDVDKILGLDHKKKEVE